MILKIHSNGALVLYLIYLASTTPIIQLLYYPPAFYLELVVSFVKIALAEFVVLSSLSPTFFYLVYSSLASSWKLCTTNKLASTRKGWPLPTHI